MSDLKSFKGPILQISALLSALANGPQPWIVGHTLAVDTNGGIAENSQAKLNDKISH